MLTASAIATWYDINLEDYRPYILSALTQSRENAGKHGRSRWSYFDGYMSDYIMERTMEDREGWQFERNAYGAR